MKSDRNIVHSVFYAISLRVAGRYPNHHALTSRDDGVLFPCFRMNSLQVDMSLRSHEVNSVDQHVSKSTL